MSEKQTPKFNMKTAGYIAAGVAGIGLLAGQGISNAESDRNKEERSQEQLTSTLEYQDSIQEAIENAIDKKTIIGSFEAEAGIAIIDQAEAVIRDQYGDSYDQASKYDTLLYSTQLLTSEANPQPGQTLHVLELELNGNEDDGKEFVVSDAPVLLDPGDKLPSPQFTN